MADNHDSPYSFGIFQEYYSSHPLFSESSGITAIGSTALALMFVPAPLLSLALQRWPSAGTPCLVIGLAINVIGLLAASFCSTVPGLIGTQGAIFAIGGVLAYFPGVQLIDQWFVKRRATAFAIVWAGSPLTGVIIPFVMQWLLDTYGFRTALRVYAVVTVSPEAASLSAHSISSKPLADSLAITACTSRPRDVLHQTPSTQDQRRRCTTQRLHLP